MSIFFLPVALLSGLELCLISADELKSKRNLLWFSRADGQLLIRTNRDTDFSNGRYAIGGTPGPVDSGMTYAASSYKALPGGLGLGKAVAAPLRNQQNLGDPFKALGRK